MLFGTQSLLAASLLGFLAQAPITSAAPARQDEFALAGRNGRVHAAHKLTSAHLGARDAVASIQAEITALKSWLAGAGTFTNAKSAAEVFETAGSQVALRLAAITSFINSAPSTYSTKAIQELEVFAHSLKAYTTEWKALSAVMGTKDFIYLVQAQMKQYESWLQDWTPSHGNKHGHSSSSIPTSALPIYTTIPLASGTVTRSMDITAISTPTSVLFPVGNYSTGIGSAGGIVTGSPNHGPSYSSVPLGTGYSSASAVNGSAQPTSTPTPPPTSGPHGLAAWWGQDPDTVPLSQMCSDSSLDIVILSFLNIFSGPGGYPVLNLGAYTGQPSTAQAAAGASGLMDGSALVPDIKACQSSGKKVYLSLGGATGGDLQDGKNATDFADMVWNLFLGGNDATITPLRPFGSVILDGIDLDHETGHPAGFSDLAGELVKKIASDSSNTYALSAAPQCPRGTNGQDASLPDDVLVQLDNVWIQYYNNPACGHGSSGFADSVKAWSQALAKGKSTKMWIAAPASSDAASNGFLSTSDVQAEIKSVLAMGLPNFGGYALWGDGTKAVNGQYDAVVKAALGS